MQPAELDLLMPKGHNHGRDQPSTCIEVDHEVDMHCQEAVKKQPWMNMLPSTWAFKVKRYPDGLVRGLKSRFCCRGDRQIEGVDFFDTYAPVVNWNTVRLLLILTAQLGLATKQVDYTAAFVHADIDLPPNYHEMSTSEKARQGACVRHKSLTCDEPLDRIDVHGAQRPKILSSLFCVDIHLDHDVKVQY